MIAARGDVLRLQERNGPQKGGSGFFTYRPARGMNLPAFPYPQQTPRSPALFDGARRHIFLPSPL